MMLSWSRRCTNVAHEENASSLHRLSKNISESHSAAAASSHIFSQETIFAPPQTRFDKAEATQLHISITSHCRAFIVKWSKRMTCMLNQT